MSDFEKEIFESQESEPIVEEIIEEQPDNLEELDDEIQTNDSEPDESIATAIEEPTVDFLVEEHNDSVGSKKGLRVFLVAIIMVLLLCIAATAGYLVSKYNNNSNSNAPSFNLVQKPNDTASLSTEEIYYEVNPSVVGIVIYDSTGPKTQATGVVYSEDGYIITNDHIYSEVPNAQFKVYTYDNKEYDATFVAGDSRTDIAVLKINSAGFFPAEFGDSSQITYGETVYAIGRPLDATAASSITNGIVSFTDRRVVSDGNYSIELIQSTAIINPGSSGGALVNEFGQVIGITSSKKVAVDYEGVCYSVPTVTVKGVVESLIANGTVIGRARLGVSYNMVDSVTAKLKNSPVGIYVAEVSEESSLYGQIKKGDYIVSVNGDKITRDDVLLDVIESSKPGDIITLDVIRSNGTTETISAALIAAESSSSYTTDFSGEENTPPESNGGTFDFPYGY